MKVLLQKVIDAGVVVDNVSVGKIERGLLLFVGFEDSGDEMVLEKVIAKLLALRLWPDDEDRMFSRSVSEIGGGVLIVSQFTLLANCKKGLRPDFSDALPAGEAKKLYDKFVTKFQERHKNVQTGSFGDYMKVNITNDGPITLWLDF